MSRTAKFALAVGVLVLAAVALLLPRVGSGYRSEPQRQASWSPPPACPKPGHGAVSELDGVQAACLAGGKPVDVGRALAGRTTVVNLWATWCAPCRDELPVLEAYGHSARAAHVLLVQIDSDPTVGAKMLDQLRVRQPSVNDGQGVGPVRKALSAPATLPASYIVDSAGKVHFVRSPRVFSSTGQVRAAVERYAS